MDNKNFPGFNPNNSNTETKILVSAENEELNGNIDAISEIRELSEGKEDVGFTAMSLPPADDTTGQLDDLNRGIRAVEKIGKDGKIANGEFKDLMVEIDALSGDPARLNDAVEKMSGEIKG